MRKISVYMTMVFLFICQLCFAETEWIEYGVFASEVSMAGSNNEPTLVDTFLANQTLRQSGPSGDVVELWPDCDSGWLCVETPALTFALATEKKVEPNTHWKYKQYGFVAEGNLSTQNFGDLVVINIFVGKRKKGSLLFSNDFGIVAFTKIRSAAGGFDSYWLLGTRGLFANSKRSLD